MKWKRVFLGMTVALLLLPGLAQMQSSADYRLNWSVVAGGGGESTSASYRLAGTAGQFLAHTSPMTSSSYRVQSGFWPAFVDLPPSALDLYMPLIIK